MTITDQSPDNVAHKAGSILKYITLVDRNLLVYLLLLASAAEDVDDDSDEEEGEEPAPESRRRSDSSPERRVPFPCSPHLVFFLQLLDVLTSHSQPHGSSKTRLDMENCASCAPL